MRTLFGMLCGFALLVPAPGALAQNRPGATAQSGEEDEEIVVVARRSGAPMWEVTRGGGTVLLVGEIAEVPKATPWRPERLEAATRRAQNVILETRPRFTIGLMFKVFARRKALTQLPKGTTSADYLSASQQRRLAELERTYGKSYERGSFFLTARDLLNNRLRFTRDTTNDATDIVRKAAGRAGIPARPVGRIEGADMLDSLLAAEPKTHVPCLDAAMSALEAGPDVVAERGAAWTRFDVPAVMASPLEIALGRCWPWTDVSMGAELRGQWVREIGRSLGQSGVTLAVVPLRVLAEAGGVLDQLKAQGAVIKGPAWRVDQPGGVPPKRGPAEISLDMRVGAEATAG